MAQRIALGKIIHGAMRVLDKVIYRLLDSTRFLDFDAEVKKDRKEGCEAKYSQFSLAAIVSAGRLIVST